MDNELGLVVPMRIDPASGYRCYRCYRMSQTDRARLVGMLRVIGSTIAQDALLHLVKSQPPPG